MERREFHLSYFMYMSRRVVRTTQITGIFVYCLGSRMGSFAACEG